jgi:O-antigen/teichoic acid export membrane protein
MSLYSKILIIAACVGLIGIPVFILDFNNLLWKNNKEIYWGMIALAALIGAVLFENRANAIQNKINDEKNKK